MNDSAGVKTRWPLADLHWDTEAVKRAVCEVIDSGQVTMGKRVAAFESAFARLVGAKHAVMVNSGSSANLLAIAIFNHSSTFIFRPEAIVPAIAWATTYAPLQQHGFRLRVVDVDPRTLAIDLDAARKAINGNTRVIVGASILGHPADLNGLRALANDHGILFLEDNCESLGASIAGKQCGTFGDVGTFSLFLSHHLQTVEGGVLVTDNDHLADMARCIRAHGWARDLAPESRLRHDAEQSAGEYCFLLPGYNLRPTELQAAIGLEQLRHLRADQLVRAANWMQFELLFYNVPGWRYQQPRHGRPVPFGFVLVADTWSQREKAVRALWAAGIETRMVTGGCFTEHPAAKHYDYVAEGDLYHAEHVHRCGFFVGNHPRDLKEKLLALRNILLNEGGL